MEECACCGKIRKCDFLYGAGVQGWRWRRSLIDLLFEVVETLFEISADFENGSLQIVGFLVDACSDLTEECL